MGTKTGTPKTTALAAIGFTDVVCTVRYSLDNIVYVDLAKVITERLNRLKEVPEVIRARQQYFKVLNHKEQRQRGNAEQLRAAAEARDAAQERLEKLFDVDIPANVLAWRALCERNRRAAERGVAARRENSHLLRDAVHVIRRTNPNWSTRRIAARLLLQFGTANQNRDQAIDALRKRITRLLK